MPSILLSLVYFYFEVTKKFQNFSEEEICLGKCSKVVLQGSKDPRLAMCDADEEPPRDALVHPCEWPSENFMDRAGIKE